MLMTIWKGDFLQEPTVRVAAKQWQLGIMTTNYEITSFYMQLYATIRGHAFRRQFDCQTQLALVWDDIKFVAQYSTQSDEN